MAVRGYQPNDRAFKLPAVPWATWRYGGGKRDVRLDLLRGFAAFAMIVNHVGHEVGGHSWVYAISGGNRFYFSAAEAFVFISGLVMGIVYGGVLRSRGTGAALQKCVRRALMLYLITIALTFGFAAVAIVRDVRWSADVAGTSLPDFVLGVLTLHRTIYLADVMLLYTFLVLAAGPVLALAARGHTRALLAGSWGLWLLWQVSPRNVAVPWPIAANDVFHIASWQVLFVTALLIGYHRRTMGERLQSLSLGLVTAASGACAAVLTALYFANRPQPSEVESGAVSPIALQFFQKADVGAGRLAAFAVFAVFVFSLVTLAWKPIRRLTGWFLLPLGESALSAYVYHTILVAGAAMAMPAIVAAGGDADALTAPTQIGGILLIWAVIKLSPHLPAWLADPTAELAPNSTEARERPSISAYAPQQRAFVALHAGPDWRW